MVKLLKDFLKLVFLIIKIFAYGLPFYFLRLYLYKYIFINEEKFRLNQIILGSKLAAFFEASGPSFIKLGQILSTRSDLLGNLITDKLSMLRDRLPPFTYKEVIKTIESQLHCKIAEAYQYIENKSIAAASIAQVHKAKTIKGEMVAIKILRPNIESRFASDISLFLFITNLLEFFFYSFALNIRLRDVITTLANTVKFELDLRYEAASADQIRDNCKHDEGFWVPKIYWNLTAQRVLTMQWVEGISINDKNALLSAGFNLHDIAKKLAVTFFNQAYRDGFFHADLHPGNLFIDNEGNLVMVDYGITGILNKADRTFLAKIIFGFINRDYDMVSELHFAAGYVPKEQSQKLFSLACRSIGEPIIGLPVNKISIATLLKQLFITSKVFQMQPQPQLLLLQKTMVTIEGVGYSIYPEVNMWQLAEPWIKKWAQENFGASAKLKNVYRDVKFMSKTFPSFWREINALVIKSNKARDYEITHKNRNFSEFKFRISNYVLSFLIGAVLTMVTIKLWF